MFLRDTYITSMLRSLAFLLLLTVGACKQSSSDAANAAVAAESEKASVHTIITDLAQSLRSDLQTAMQQMNAVSQAAESMRMGNDKEKGAENENVEAVFEKSSSVVGAMLVLQGSLNAVEQRFNEGILDQKQAEEMLRKLRVDLQSYQNDIKNYRGMLGTSAPGASEKK